LECTALISTVWPEPPSDERLHIIVRLPGLVSPTLANAVGVRLGFVGDYEDIFIKVKEWGAFDGSDIERSGIRMFSEGCAPVPDFVANLEQKLDSKPGLDPDVCFFLDHCFNADWLM
jgi:hypothetical protein